MKKVVLVIGALLMHFSSDAKEVSVQNSSDNNVFLLSFQNPMAMGRMAGAEMPHKIDSYRVDAQFGRNPVSVTVKVDPQNDQLGIVSGNQVVFKDVEGVNTVKISVKGSIETR